MSSHVARWVFGKEPGWAFECQGAAEYLIRGSWEVSCLSPDGMPGRVWGDPGGGICCQLLAFLPVAVAHDRRHPRWLPCLPLSSQLPRPPPLFLHGQLLLPLAALVSCTCSEVAPLCLIPTLLQ